MKVILNDDVKHLGEMGDVKNVARGYARNYLFPHMFAVPYTDETVKYFEGKKAEIEARKAQKRSDAASLKEKLEATTIELTVPASANGKLFGAVTSLTLADYLSKNGYEIERKRIEIPGLTIKSIGNYEFKVHLYETAVAVVKLSVKPQETASSAKADESKKAAKSKDSDSSKADEQAADAPADSSSDSAQASSEADAPAEN